MKENTKKDQTSPRSFRLTDDVMAKFQEFQKELGYTQDQALSTLVRSFEMEKAKNEIPDRETEIRNFQMKANELVEAFLHSLQLNLDAETRIRGEVALQLQTKDNTIIDLQGKVKAQTEKIAELRAATEEAEKRVKLAEQAAKEAEKRAVSLEEKAKDKEDINIMLTGKLAQAESKLDGYDQLKESEADLKEKLREAVREIKETKREVEIAGERAVLQAEKEKNVELKELYNQILELQKEKSDLKDQIYSLQQKISIKE